MLFSARKLDTITMMEWCCSMRRVWEIGSSRVREKEILRNRDLRQMNFSLLFLDPEDVNPPLRIT